MPRQVLTPTNFSTDNDQLTVDFIYNTVSTQDGDPPEGEAQSNNLSVGLFYNSDEFSPADVGTAGIEFPNQLIGLFAQGTIANVSDDNDLDNNPDTDSVVRVGFLDQTAPPSFPSNSGVDTGYTQGEDALFNATFTVVGTTETDITVAPTEPTTGDLDFDPLEPVTFDEDGVVDQPEPPEGNPVNLTIEPTAGSEDAGTTFTITATADQQVTADETVALALNGDADVDDFVEENIPAQITILNGETTGTVEVTVNDDDVEEGEETATFTISNPTDGIALGDTVEASATIADNDDAGEPTVELSVDPSEGSEEGETAFTFTATASEAVTGEQTVNLALSGDADADDFVGDLPTAITIADGDTTGTVEVTVNDDDVEEGEETANFALENPPEGFVLGANTNVDITIEDNDPEESQADFNDDGITNLDDLGLFAAAFNSAEGDANYNPAVELTGDTSINNDDLGQLATFFTEEFAV